MGSFQRKLPIDSLTLTVSLSLSLSVDVTGHLTGIRESGRSSG
jgi:hypothetical protein